MKKLLLIGSFLSLAFITNASATEQAFIKELRTAIKNISGKTDNSNNIEKLRDKLTNIMLGGYNKCKNSGNPIHHCYKKYLNPYYSTLIHKVNWFINTQSPDNQTTTLDPTVTLD